MFKTSNFKLLTHLIIDCYKSNRSHDDVTAVPDDDNGKECPRNFDGYACWDRTPDGTIAIQNCPENILGVDPKRMAFKQCFDDGSSFKMDPNGTDPWTDYTACAKVDDLNFVNIVNNIYVYGYAVSTLALILSILIFIRFRSLHCIRNSIHIHLFTSFILNNISWIVWCLVIVSDVNVMAGNEIWCKILHIITHYFMLTGYAWMFCEALHLQVNLEMVFVNDERSMLIFNVIGWISPMPIIFFYAIRRHFTATGTERCWIENSDAFWIISVPVVITLLISVGFLVNIVRILIQKSNRNENEGPVTTSLKAARAIFLLIPLFGLHFFLIPFRPSGDTGLERAYHVFSAVLVSFQGLCVAVLFCFMNHEVLAAIKTFIARRRDMRDVRPVTGVTEDSVMQTRENSM